MRSLVRVGATVLVAASVALVGVASAGDFHQGDTLKCQDCHVMHFSQQHGYNADGSGTFTPYANGPHNRLLREEVNNLCLSCHDGGGAPDVFEENSDANIRSAGALNDTLSDEGTTGYDPRNGHTLRYSGSAPGSTYTTTSLDCAECHNPHGNAFFRNLRDDAGNNAAGTAQITYTVDTTVNTATDVWVDTAPGNRVYDQSLVWYNEPNTTGSEYTEFCGGCHEDFLVFDGTGGASAVDYHRHPAHTADIGGARGTTGVHSDAGKYLGRLSRVKVMDPLGAHDGSGTNLTPGCFSCHKPHGNQNAFGLIYMAGSDGLGVDEEGDTAGTEVRDLCGQCHTQGD